MVDISQSADGGFNFLADLIHIQIRNLEAIQQAQKKMLEGIGIFTKSQTEIVEGTLRRSVSNLPNVISGDVRAAASNQIESMKTMIQENQANANILSEIATRNSGEVAALLQSRMMAALDELKAALENAIPDQTPLSARAAPAA